MNLIGRARELRRDGSRAEKICWNLIRDRRIDGAKFRRQHPIGPYFADFACISRRLVIEIDGNHHAYQVNADARRTAAMEQLGWRVVRFWANEVVANPEGVWATIEQMLMAPVTPHPPSPPSGGEEYEESMTLSHKAVRPASRPSVCSSYSLPEAFLEERVSHGQQTVFDGGRPGDGGRIVSDPHRVGPVGASGAGVRRP